MITPHTPNDHKNHELRCGCWTGNREIAVTMCECGALYEYAEVISFPRFKCYDCGRVTTPDSGERRKETP